MSIASTIPCIKIKISPSPLPHPSKFCSPKPYFTVRSSKAEGPLRRPAAPSLSPLPVSTVPSLSPPPSPSPAPPAKPAVPSGEAQVASTLVGEVKGVVTLEFQRRMAKELQDYFRRKKLEEADQGPFFGFVGKNEITNGRWAMFGFAVGLLTEYATGSDLAQQLKILLSNFGVVDLD